MEISEWIPKETAREYAFRNLKNAIVRLELKPGQMVSENELSNVLGISRTPVREALIELSRNGVVEIQRQRGSRISLIDYKRVEESQFFRRVLEEGVVKILAAEKSIDIISIKENLELQKFYYSNKKYTELLDMDNSFHKLLFQLADKMHCYKTLQSMSIPFDRVRNLSLDSVKNLKIVEDHESIVAAIINHDVDLAASAMNYHLTRYDYDKKEIFENCPESYFKK